MKVKGPVAAQLSDNRAMGSTCGERAGALWLLSLLFLCSGRKILQVSLRKSLDSESLGPK